MLWIALVGGCLGAVLGTLNWMGLQPDASRVPAIVIVPQMIQAVLVAGFGVVAATIGAAGLAFLDAAGRQQAMLDRIARQTEQPPAPPPHIPKAAAAPAGAPAATPAATPAAAAAGSIRTEQLNPRRNGHVPFGMKPCPSCGELGWHDAHTCSKCGTTFAMAKPMQKTCGACGATNPASIERCQRCDALLPLAPLPRDPSGG